jgi:hypothetical protein
MVADGARRGRSATVAAALALGASAAMLVPPATAQDRKDLATIACSMPA